MRGTCANPGVPQCQRCWRWGHSTRTCHTKMPRCPCCSGSHSEDNHCALVGCCKDNPKVDPPVKPMAAGDFCSHSPWYVNCNGTHTANDWKCRYWCHYFDCGWILKMNGWPKA
jgi:hypothetical protein